MKNIFVIFISTAWLGCRNYSLDINEQPGSLNIDCFVMLEMLEALMWFHCAAAVSIMGRLEEMMFC